MTRNSQAQKNNPNRQATGIPAKRMLAVLFSLILTAGLLAGCGGEEGPAAENGLSVRGVTDQSFEGTVTIGYSGDVPDVSPLLEALPDTYETKAYETDKDAKDALLAGETDLAIVTPGGAASLYRADGTVRAVGPVYLGGYRLVGNTTNINIQSPARGGSGTAVNTNSSSEDGTGAAEAGAVSTGEWSAPHDPVEAGEIGKENILPSQLRSGRVNIWHESETLMDLAAALFRMDGFSGDVTIIRRYEEETPRDYITDYNHFSLTNILTDYGGQEAFTNLDELLDVDAYWQAMTGEPLPSAVLVASGAFLESAAAAQLDAAAILARDFDAAMGSIGGQSGNARIVYYGSSNRGDSILRTYYDTVYGSIGKDNSIPGADFYLGR